MSENGKCIEARTMQARLALTCSVHPRRSKGIFLMSNEHVMKENHSRVIL